MFAPETTRFFAIGVLVVAGLVPVAWAAWRLWRSPYTLSQTVLCGANYLMTRLLWRAEVRGRWLLPPGQGAVIVSNHRSSIDPAFFALALMRVVHWMVAKEYCRRRAFRWLLRTIEVIPTSRAGVDTAATKAAIRLAQQGGLVGLFPEGRINTTSAPLLPGRPGAALIALKARVPVVPCYIHGSPYDGTPWGCVFMPARVRVHIGPPIDLSAYYGRERQREVLEELTRRLLQQTARLGGHEDFQPQLAGRGKGVSP